MFIAIDAKADIAGGKKGKLTPAQHAQINAWCLASKTGIFDCLEKCLAEKSSYDISNGVANVVFRKGYIAICGRIVECEAGTTVEVNTDEKPSGSIVLRYDLSSSKEKEFEVIVTDSPLVQDDLNSNTLTGKYEFELYSYSSSQGTLTLTRNQDYIPAVAQIIKNLTGSGMLGNGEAPLQGYDNSKGTLEERLKSAEAPLQGYDNSKGTLEERLKSAENRLTNLGFRTGSISATNISNATLKRQGNYVIGSFTVYNSFSFVLPDGFRPKETVESSVGNYHYNTTNRLYRGGGGTITFSPNGNVNCTINGDWQGTANVCFGYEANPI